MSSSYSSRPISPTKKRRPCSSTNPCDSHYCKDGACRNIRILPQKQQFVKSHRMLFRSCYETVTYALWHRKWPTPEEEIPNLAGHPSRCERLLGRLALSSLWVRYQSIRKLL